jgi:hypothetical protein
MIVSNCDQHVSSPDTIDSRQRTHQTVGAIKSFKMETLDLIDYMAFRDLQQSCPITLGPTFDLG